jgi:CheY-like chemotaxis protein
MNIKALVVDDNPAVRMILVMLLASRGIVIEEANGPDQALHMFEAASKTNKPFNCIISDLEMGDTDAGYKFATKIRAINKDVPFIIVTGRYPEITPEVMQHGVDQGVTDILSKPYQPGELFGMLNLHMGLSLT